MSRLANLKTAKVVQALKALGWAERATSTGKNPHIIMKQDGNPVHISIPNHKGKDVKPGLLSRILKDAGVDIDTFLNAL